MDHETFATLTRKPRSRVKQNFNILNVGYYNSRQKLEGFFCFYNRQFELFYA